MGRTSDSTSSTRLRAARRAPLARVAGRVRAGHVAGAHGLRGQVRLQIRGGGDWLERGISLVLADRDAETGRRYELAAVTPGRRDEWRVTLLGVDEREAAEALRGLQVFVDPEILEPLEENEIYAYQLVGCTVSGEDGTAVGEVTGLWETGSDVLVVAGADGREHLVPTALLRAVDADSRRVVVEILPGLLEAE